MLAAPVALATLLSVPVSGATSPAPTGGATPAGSSSAQCTNLKRLKVPGAEKQKVACLDDLTTAGTLRTGHTQLDDWATLHAPGTVNPTGVPGVQIDGYFRDTSTFNTYNGWNHDSQFVIRMPADWNGGLVVSGAPGVRKQYANDFAISDWVLSKGYAFASTDKGNNGLLFFKDQTTPGGAIAEGNHRMTELTRAAKKVVERHYSKKIAKTYAYGVSNGGYLVRWQLENHPELYDGGVDWEGVLYSKADNALGFFPPALQNFPAAARGDQKARQAILNAGFTPESEFLWPFHYQWYWDGTQRLYREVFDPSFDGDTFAPDGTPGKPFCTSGPGCDTFYDLSTRPGAQAAIARPDVRLTGKIGKPLITIHGVEDTLLPITRVSDAYAGMVKRAGKAHLHRYYRFEDANHFDGLRQLFPQVRPLLPCSRTSFTALESWTATTARRHKHDLTAQDSPFRRRGNTAPPPSATLAAPTSGDVLNTCSLTAGAR